MSEDMSGGGAPRVLPVEKADPTPLSGVAEGGLFNTADIVVFVIFVVVLIAFFLYKKYQESKVITIKPISLQQFKTSGPETGQNILERMNASSKQMVVFYGSQTGTAEEFATRLCKEAKHYGIAAMSADPIEYDMESLKGLREREDHIAVFLMATYGEGEPTDNAIQFYELITNDETDLEGLNFAVFGLGNSTYEHFNKMGKDTDRLLEKRGGTRLSVLALGDDDANIEDDYMNWREVFFGDLCKTFGVTKSADNLDVRNYKLEVHTDLPTNEVYRGEIGGLGGYATQRPPYDTKNPYLARLTTNYNLCAVESDRAVYHCEVDISNSRIRYEAGDHIAIFPENNATLVSDFGTRLSVDLDTVISLKCIDEFSSKKTPFPCPTTYRTALTHYVDITTPPRTNVLKDLAQYAGDEKEKAFLIKISSNTNEGKNEYNDWVIKDQRHMLQILQDLPSLAPPLDHIMELLPRLQARYYSIASSSKSHPDTVHVCAALVRYKTSTGRVAEGVCTTWLEKMVPSESNEFKIPVFVRRNQGFRLPRRTQTPVIMVGPGTGIAPFRGFIQDRATVIRSGRECGANVLFFGCRHEKKDYLYEEELKEYEKEGVLQLFTAFSRDSEKKVYVQHLMEEKSSMIWQLISEEGAHFYVCGDARLMARDVHKQLLAIVEKHGGLEPSQAEAFVVAMENTSRYQKDVWS